MKNKLGSFLLFTISLTLLIVGCKSSNETSRAVVHAISPPPGIHLPWREAGLTEREAAAHLLNRFTFGPHPGDIDRVVKVGLEQWFAQQLSGNLPDDELNRRFEPFKTLKMTDEKIALAYPSPGQIFAMAYRDSIVSRRDTTLDRADVRQKVEAYYQDKGFRPPRELIGELMVQKLYRAVYSENQVIEMLTDFWFNHFNVSIIDNQARTHVLTYERDAIRPNVTGKFRNLLGATAKHPAMLFYLSNAQSTSPEGTPTTMSVAVEKYRNIGGVLGWFVQPRVDQAMREYQQGQQQAQRELQQLPPEFRPRRGINENYARELMELHTLGVDGGYTQQDVVEVARAFTGWTVYPMGPQAEQARERIEKRREGAKNAGFVFDGSFVFRADAHDATEKTILNAKFPAGGGVEEGERVLDMLSRHPSTAKFIARKLAIRFGSDHPSQALVSKLAEVFLKADGDLIAMMWTIVESPEFWSKEALRAKIKSSFELTASTLRALDVDIRRPRPLLEWIAKMGQPLYAYQAPTGYPDRAEFWINSGSLLHRMNFGLNLALGKIPGMRIDLLKLNQNHEPESPEAALKTYAALLLPERDISETVNRLLPMIHDVQLVEKVSEAAPKPSEKVRANEMTMDEQLAPQNRRPQQRVDQIDPSTVIGPTSLARVVGVIIGSPEFQRK